MIYLDSNVIKILNNIPLEEDVSEIEDSYLLQVFKAALKSLVIFEAKHKPESMSFLEDVANFRNSFKGLEASVVDPDINMDDAEYFLNKLIRGDFRFKEIFSGYLDAINKTLIEEGLKANPSVVGELRSYLKKVKDATARVYLASLVEDLREEE